MPQPDETETETVLARRPRWPRREPDRWSRWAEEDERFEPRVA